MFAIDFSVSLFMLDAFLYMAQVNSLQLRDDLSSMLVAGHETTGSVLTWTIYLLSKVLLFISAKSQI